MNNHNQIIAELYEQFKAHPHYQDGRRIHGSTWLWNQQAWEAHNKPLSHQGKQQSPKMFVVIEKLDDGNYKTSYTLEQLKKMLEVI